MSLTAQHAAYCSRSAKPLRNPDHLYFAIDCFLASIRVGMCEIGRATQHRHHKACLVNGLAHGIDVVVFEAREEILQHLETVGVELLGHLDPLEYSHGPLAGDLLDVTFRKCGDPERHGLP